MARLGPASLSLRLTPKGTSLLLPKAQYPAFLVHRRCLSSEFLCHPDNPGVYLGPQRPGPWTMSQCRHLRRPHRRGGSVGKGPLPGRKKENVSDPWGGVYLPHPTCMGHEGRDDTVITGTGCQSSDDEVVGL